MGRGVLTWAREIRRALSNPHALAEALGLAKGAKRQRGGLVVLCPFHKEKTPSCSVMLGEDGTIRVHCFGCDASGDALTLIAGVRGFDIRTQFDRVLEEAAELAGMRIEARREPVAPRISATEYNAIATRLHELTPWTAEPDGVRYFEDRVLVVSGSHAGLSVLPPRHEQRALVARLCATFEPETLACAGLVGRDGAGRSDLTAFSFAENRLVIPWRGLDGSIQVLQRRRLDGQRASKYVFPPGMRPSLPFGAEQLRANDTTRAITWCEGALDVLALRVLDHRDRSHLLPLGLPGTDGWRPEWAKYCQGRDVWLALDRDDAGDRAAERIAADVFAGGASSVRRLRPKFGKKDWAELLVHEVSAHRPEVAL